MLGMTKANKAASPNKSLFANKCWLVYSPMTHKTLTLIFQYSVRDLVKILHGNHVTKNSKYSNSCTNPISADRHAE